MMRLQNNVAIITGAGSGMGRAMAELFAREGAKVVAADVNSKGVDALIASLKGIPGEVVFRQVDVTDSTQVDAMVDFAVQKYGRLDIMVNNAGIGDRNMPAGEVDNELWDKVLKVDLYGVLYGTRAAINVMLEQETGGRIINTASVAGLQGTRAGAAYTAAKHGVVGLTKNTAFMYANKNIRVNMINPGAINTNIQATMQEPSALGTERAMAGLALNPRTAEPTEIAEIALFLASDESSFINGATIVADGGWTAY